MVRPTDPAKLAALRARQAAASAAYRARQRTAANLPITRGPSAHGGGSVVSAQQYAESLRVRRAELLRQLPLVQNPKANIRPKERTARMAPKRKTKAGQQRQAKAIRDRANAERLQPLGKSRKAQLVTELYDGAQSERLQEAMTGEQRRRFQRLSEIIASGSAQSVAILFEHTGGQSLYTGALDRILASPESRDVEEGLDMLETLAEYAVDAARLYAPSRIGRITV